MIQLNDRINPVCVSPPVFCLQLFRVEVLFNGRKHFVLRRSSEFQTLHRKVRVWKLCVLHAALRVKLLDV